MTYSRYGQQQPLQQQQQQQREPQQLQDQRRSSGGSGGKVCSSTSQDVTLALVTSVSTDDMRETLLRDGSQHTATSDFSSVSRWDRITRSYSGVSDWSDPEQDRLEQGCLIGLHWSALILECSEHVVTTPTPKAGAARASCKAQWKADRATKWVQFMFWFKAILAFLGTM